MGGGKFGPMVKKIGGEGVDPLVLFFSLFPTNIKRRRLGENNSKK